MAMSLETLGNATLLFYDGTRPVLVTDPWLAGTSHFGSWALEAPLTDVQTSAVCRAPYVFISQGHPDHLHTPSLDLLPRATQLLIPDYRDRDIYDVLKGKGFDVTVLPYRQTVRLADSVAVTCVDTETGGGILVVEAGDALVIDLNDASASGEVAYLRRRVRRHPNDKTYLAARCAIDPVLVSFIGTDGNRLVGPPEEMKKEPIRDLARLARRLGVRHYLMSSSQHICIRDDTAWANAWRVTFEDIEHHWPQDGVHPIEPFVSIDLGSGEVIPARPLIAPEWSRVNGGTGDDVWDEPLTLAEWRRVDAFVRSFEVIRDDVDFIQIVVGGEDRRMLIGPKAHNKYAHELTGIEFIAPRRSLLQAVDSGRFDDLLAAGFVTARLHNRPLDRYAIPRLARLGGDARIRTRAQQRKANSRYFRRNPLAHVAARLGRWWSHQARPWFDRLAGRVAAGQSSMPWKGGAQQDRG